MTTLLRKDYENDLASQEEEVVLFRVSESADYSDPKHSIVPGHIFRAYYRTHMHMLSGGGQALATKFPEDGHWIAIERGVCTILCGDPDKLPLLPRSDFFS